MSMQLCAIDPPKSCILPPSDIDKMKVELEKIDKFMKEIDAGKATKETYENLKTAVVVANEIILSLDNSNDFFKIGGFNQLPPLLACSEPDVVAAAAELIADLCQNNAYCQSKMLDFNVMPELVKLIDSHSDPKVCFKALYALSCLCRHNEDALEQLEISGFLPVLIKLIQKPDQRLRTKTAFFLSYLVSNERFRDTEELSVTTCLLGKYHASVQTQSLYQFCTLYMLPCREKEALYQAEIVKILIKLLDSDHDSSTEHLLSALETQVASHKQSRIQCRKDEYNLKQILQSKIKLYESSREYDEGKQHCSKILDYCFHDKMTS